ncbi:T-complex protein 1 subunit eta-like [Quercus lobata]|uniref:T-complex protein 1 subunit eta-like n=1 Tax=Quercus lobata TaxID=97700 RepID=UPI0012461291|nr:T-complex protein 1 subunit eta-like [Quercus lobata]
MLYPLPIHGEASNHSSVALENPNFSTYPRAKCAMEHSQKVVLHASDALLFLKAGQDQVLHKTTSTIMGDMKRHICELPSIEKADHRGNDLDQACEEANSKEKEVQQKNLLQDLEPIALQVLHEIVSLVHDYINISDHSQLLQSTLIDDSAARVKGFEQQPKKFLNPKILLLNIKLELKSEKENAEIRLSNPSQYQSIVDAEWNIIYDKLDKCVQSGAKVVLSRLAIGDLATQEALDDIEFVRSP